MKRTSCLILGPAVKLMCLCAVMASAGAWSGRRTVPADLSQLHARRLLSDSASTDVYIADFEWLSTQNVSSSNIDFEEKLLRGALPIHAQTQRVQYGAYDLTPDMVIQLTTMIVEQLVRFSRREQTWLVIVVQQPFQTQIEHPAVQHGTPVNVCCESTVSAVLLFFSVRAHLFKGFSCWAFHSRIFGVGRRKYANSDTDSTASCSRHRTLIVLTRLLSSGARACACGASLLGGIAWLLRDVRNRSASQQLQDEVPPHKSQMLGPVYFPGTQLDGHSVMPKKSGQQPLRIPTVYAPFHSGTVFDFGPRAGDPGVTLHFSNITLALPNVTYSELHQSGFINFFKFSDNARVCITNRSAPLKLVSPCLY
jgi:hypothetical protein